VAVSTTELTVDAPAGTVTCAWSCRLADLESIAPRSHEAVPSLLPQPKLNFGDTADGVAASRMVESGTLPPVVQALTTQWTGPPRLLLDCEGVTLMQRLILVAVSAPWVPVVGVGLVCVLLMGVADACGVVGFGVVELGVGVVVPGVGVGVGVGVRVGELDVRLGVEVWVEVRLGVGIEVEVGVGVGVVTVKLATVAVCEGVVVGVGLVSVGVGEGLVGVGDGLGAGAGRLSGSHDVPLVAAPLLTVAVVAAVAAVT
jgi:hypothetical protein